MNTPKQITQKKATQISNEKGVDTWFNEQAIKFEQTRFGWMAIYITIQSCFGSVACMLILQNNASDFMLASCAAVSMASNAVFIAQGSGKWCLGTFYFSVLLNAIFILVNI